MAAVPNGSAAGAPKNDKLGAENYLRIESVRKEAGEHFRRIVEHTAAAHGAKAEIRYIEYGPALRNDPALAERMKPTLAQVAGEQRAIEIEPVMGGEDFAYYLQRVPGAFAMLGTGDGRPYPHHNARFDIDETVLPLGVRLMTAVAMEMMEQE